MASAVETVKGSAGRIMQWIKTHPAIAGLLAVGVVVIAYIAYKNNQGGGSPTGTQQAGQDQTGLGGGLGEIQPTPPPDIQPISTTGGSGGGLIGATSGGGGGGGRRGGGGGGGTVAASSSLAPAAFAPAATGPTDPYTQLLQSAYINPQTGQVNLFETQAAGNLINSIGGPTVQQMQSNPTMASSPNLVKVNTTAPAPTGISPKTPVATATRIAQNQADINAANNFFGGVGNFFANLFGGGTVANQAAADVNAMSGGAAGLVNQINKTATGLFSDVGAFLTGAPLPTATAHVTGSAVVLQAPIHSEGGLAVSTPPAVPAPKPVSPLTGLPASPSKASQLPTRSYNVAPRKIKVGVGKNASIGIETTNPYTGQKNIKY